MLCAACQADIKEGAKFCVECGAPLPRRCSSCGAEHEIGQRFCAGCGSALAPPAPPSPPAEAVPAAAELRPVSVLFVDLVGYTSLAESRDAEDARELLGHYFDQAKTVIGRHGGTIEKFIGDAVMAVWGAPVAHEDDAERAVRAALELVDAVGVFGAEANAPGLRARAGVVTGQAASATNPGEGLVVGDRVNTAARVQSVADPGSVFVDEVTRQVTSAAIGYEDAGSRSVKGKAEPVRLWRALRAVAGVAGAQRGTGLEVPFVGRDAELRLIKDLFHATVDRGGARLVAITGAAGVGKTRLGSEFSNYVDGLVGSVLWHSGRCLSYGEGIAYWALAEMVRQRFGIAEEASVEEASAQLTAGLPEWIGDPQERQTIAPALGVLIGIPEPGLGRDELFAAWRLFFERLSEHEPVVLLFEDMQWADDGLLDFIEQLLDWTADHPIFIASFARPELSERRPSWPRGVRAATALPLEPLDDADIANLLEGLVADIPQRSLRKIVAQAEGVPLYAVETVLALANRGVLAQSDGRLRLLGDLGDLDVPASLSSLLAARLDELSQEERELVKAMAVFGGSFPRASAAALADVAAERLDEVLASLVRSEVMTIRTDPLSPDRGQYAFAQGMLRAVAYEMIPKRERGPRHLAAAEHLREAFADEGEEVVEAVAAHLLDAYRAGGEDPGSNALRERALAALRRAAQRAEAVGAPAAAERALRTASELATVETERTELLEGAARMALLNGSYEAALDLCADVTAAHTAAGRERDAARVATLVGSALSLLGRADEAIAAMRPALEVLASAEPDPDTAELSSELAGALLAKGEDPEEAGKAIERALAAAEALELPAVTCRALDLKGRRAHGMGHFEEAAALYDRAIAIGERHRLPLRAAPYINSADLRLMRDMPGALELCEAALSTSRRLGDRGAESVAIANLMSALLILGRWEENEQLALAALEGDEDRPDTEYVNDELALLQVMRGRLEAARSGLARMEAWRRSENSEHRACYQSIAGLIARGEGELDAAFELLAGAVRASFAIEGASSLGVRRAWPDAFRSALELGRFDEAEQLLAMLANQPRGLVPPLLRAELSHAQGLLAGARGGEDAEARFTDAIDGLRALGYPYWLARAQTDLGEWLRDQDRSQEAATWLQRALAIGAQLAAEPLLAHARDLLEPLPAVVAVER